MNYKMIKQIVAVLTLTTFFAASGPAQLLFTQYYEGPGTNKWVELKNLGGTSVDLSSYTLSAYFNGNAEIWKAGTAATAVNSNWALSGNIAAGNVFVLGNTLNTVPSYASAFATNNSIINFNGNDSLVLWFDNAAFSTSQIADVLSFTNVGNEGVDKSFVRISTAAGYNLTTGSNIAGPTFSNIWSLTSLANVNGATVGTNDYLGSSNLVPEPQTWFLLGIGFMALVIFGRRRFVRVTE